MMVAHIPPVRNSRTRLRSSQAARRNKTAVACRRWTKKKKEKFEMAAYELRHKPTTAWPCHCGLARTMAPVVRYSLTKSQPLIRQIESRPILVLIRASQYISYLVHRMWCANFWHVYISYLAPVGRNFVYIYLFIGAEWQTEYLCTGCKI